MLMVDHAGTIVLVNAQIEWMLGYAREDVEQRPSRCWFPERFRGSDASPTHHSRGVRAWRNLRVRSRRGSCALPQ